MSWEIGSLRLTAATSLQLAADSKVEDVNFVGNLSHICRTDDTQCRIGFRVADSSRRHGQQPSTGNARLALLLVPAEIGRANVCTPVTNAHLVCRLLLEKKN